MVGTPSLRPRFAGKTETTLTPRYDSLHAGMTCPRKGEDHDEDTAVVRSPEAGCDSRRGRQTRVGVSRRVTPCDGDGRRRGTSRVGVLASALSSRQWWCRRGTEAPWANPSRRASTRGLQGSISRTVLASTSLTLSLWACLWLGGGGGARHASHGLAASCIWRASTTAGVVDQVLVV